MTWGQKVGTLETHKENAVKFVYEQEVANHQKEIKLYSTLGQLRAQVKPKVLALRSPSEQTKTLAYSGLKRGRKTNAEKEAKRKQEEQEADGGVEHASFSCPNEGGDACGEDV